MPTTDPHAIVELRQYTLHPQQREVLIDLFDREFVETQEAQGMRVLGQFRDLDRPDQFVWLRGFADMQARHRALEGFYGGPVWAAHRHAANATMIDSDNVHLLRSAWPGATASLPQHARPEPRTQGAAAGVLQLTTFPLRGPPHPSCWTSAATAWCTHCCAAARASSPGSAPSTAPTPLPACRCAKANPCWWAWPCLATRLRCSRLPTAGPGRVTWRPVLRPGWRQSPRCCACSPPRARRCMRDAPAHLSP